MQLEAGLGDYLELEAEYACSLGGEGVGSSVGVDLDTSDSDIDNYYAEIEGVLVRKS